MPVLLELFAELADYERLTHELHASAEDLASALFGERPAAEAFLAERPGDGAVLGYALFYPTFSSFLAKPGIWLEDLFVRADSRGLGVGRSLLAAVASRTIDLGGERLEWAALDWNELALGFYRGIGAETTPEWITHRLAGPSLASVADQA